MANIYFSTTGNDVTGTGAIGNPYATGTKALTIAVAGDTVIARDGAYNTQVIICNGKVGTQANPITIKAENDQQAILQGKANTLYCVDINNSDWIILQDFDIQLHTVNSPDKKNDHAIIVRGGSTNIRITNNSITQLGQTPSEAAMQANYVAGWRSQAIAVRANVVVCEIDHNTIGGVNKGISSSGVTDSIHIHHNIVQNCVQSNIHFSSGEQDVEHHHLVEDNLFDYCFMEDLVQSIPDPGNPDGTTYENIQILFRRNIGRYAGENAWDSKGGAMWFIEDGIIYGVLGSNDGRLDTATADPNTNSPNLIVCGANQITKHRTMINTICYDNNGGFSFHDYDNLINCTFWFNRRNYTGSNTGTDATKFIAANFTESSANPVIIRNNIFGRSYVGVGIRTAGNQGVDIDYNGYVLNDKVGKNNTTGDYYDGSAEWKGFLNGLGFVTGKEAHSIYSNGPASALWTNVPENPTDTHDNYDFTTRTTSPFYHTGGHITTTALAGTNTTSIKLTNPYPFRGTMGRDDVVGHTIYIAGAGARVIQDINYTTQIATLTQAGTWANGALVYMGDSATPNIGSAPFGESGGGGGGGGGETPVDITLVGIPLVVSTTAIATLTITGFAPAAHELALVAVMTRNNTVVHNVTGGGLTWVAAGSVIMEGTNGHLTLWRALSQTTPTGGDLTITATGNTTSFMAMAWKLAGVNQEGTHGSGALEVIVTDNGPPALASDHNMLLPITTLSDKAWAMAVGTHRSTTFTPAAGETEISINNHVGSGASDISISAWYEVTTTAGTVTLGQANDLSDNQWWSMIVVSVKPNTDTGPVVVDMSASPNKAVASTIDPTVTAPGGTGVTVTPNDNIAHADTVDPTVTIGQSINMAAFPNTAIADTIDPTVFALDLDLSQNKFTLRARPTVLTLRKRGRNMFSREIVQSPWDIGEDEIWQKPIDTGNWGGSPASPVFELKHVSDTGILTPITVVDQPTISGDFFIPPPISPSALSLITRHRYRIECTFSVGSETLECYGFFEVTV